MTTDEPVTIGGTDAFQAIRERLEARGVEPYVGEIPLHETAEEGIERRARAHAAAVSRWEARRPVMYADADVALLDADQGTVAIAAWVRDPSALNLILAGPVGTGKTYAGYALGNHLIQANKTVEAWTVHDLLEALRPSGDTAPWVAKVDVLLVDDLGAGQPTEWAVETMTAILDERLREERRTIVTTNLTEPQITAAWGDRFMDRLRHRSTVVVCQGQSRRTPAW
jgi:hypothetical protein